MHITILNGNISHTWEDFRGKFMLIFETFKEQVTL